jgi:hypothetical protein
VFADPKLVRRRRLKRQLKAAASVLIAVAAGTFLACQRQLGNASSPADREPSGRGVSDGDRTGSPSDAAVDVDQHRKGMPVPDNLLE